MSNRGYLLDVNVLLSLGFSSHQHHQQVINFLSTTKKYWATCSITELGFIRISSINAIFGETLNPFKAQIILDNLCQNSRHIYLSENPSVLRCDFSQLTGHKQTTDAYLLELAKYHNFKLLTLDKRLYNSYKGIDVVLIQ